MKYTLPTYERAVSLTIGKRFAAEIGQYLDSAFYEAKAVVEGYNVSIFNYRLAGYSDFADNEAFELRGLTYVFNEDGTLFKAYRLLHKFFNLNQVEETQYSRFKDKETLSVYVKEDGSVGSFIRLPNGKAVAKSKMSFESDQALGMNRIYERNKEIREFVEWALDNDIVAVFEYVAPHNRIVLKYDKEEMILLRMRSNSTGEYLDLDDYRDKIGSIKTPMKCDMTLDDVVEAAKTQEGIEGWVVDMGMLVKVKTAWYSSLHGLLTDDIYRENRIVERILSDDIDDVLGQIPEDEKEARERIEKVIAAVSTEMNRRVAAMKSEYAKFAELRAGMDCAESMKTELARKAWAMSHRKDPLFAEVMSMAKGKDPYDIAKDRIAKETFRLQGARDLLWKIDPTLNFKDVRGEA
jgi:T4 RnlA family RNA ligase